MRKECNISSKDFVEMVNKRFELLNHQISLIKERFNDSYTINQEIKLILSKKETTLDCISYDFISEQLYIDAKRVNYICKKYIA